MTIDVDSRPKAVNQTNYYYLDSVAGQVQINGQNFVTVVYSRSAVSGL